MRKSVARLDFLRNEPLHAALAWASVLHLVFWRLFLPHGVFDFAIRSALMFLLTRWVWRRAGSEWGLAWLSFLSGIFLVPLLALFLRSDFLFYLARAGVVAGFLLWLSGWLILLKDQGKMFRPRRADWVYGLLIIGWGWWLCAQIVDAQGMTSGSGWLWRYHEDELMRAIYDDGQQYIFLGQNLGKLLSTMHRLPGYPLLTRLVFMFLARNFYILIVSNVLFLLATVHLSVKFASRYIPYRVADVLRPCLVLLFAAYLSGERLLWYRLVLTDALSDFIMVTHLYFLHDFIQTGQRIYLKRTVQSLLAAFLLRPTIVYYSLALWALLSVWSWFKGRSAWSAQLKNSLESFSFKDRLKGMGRVFVCWLILPLMLLMTFNRVRHGVFSFSSIQGHVLTYATYGSMIALDKGITYLKLTRPFVDDDFGRWYQKERVDDSHLSRDGITTVFAKKFALEKFIERPVLFIEVIETGLRRLLLHHGYADLIILLLALGLGAWKPPWCFLLLWPLYLIPIYTLEGLAMEYRLTLQITLPALFVLSARLAQGLGRWMPPGALAATDSPEPRSLRSSTLFTFDFNEARALFWSVILSSCWFAVMPLFQQTKGSETSLREDLGGGRVVATSWQPESSTFLYRRKAALGALETVTLTVPENLPRAVEERLMAKELLPFRFVDRFLHPPRLAERSAFLDSLGALPGGSGAGGREAGGPSTHSAWDVRLNGLSLGHLRSSSPSADFGKVQGVSHSSWSLELSPWITAIFPLSASLDVDWLDDSCTVLTEQTRVVQEDRSMVYTSFYPAGRPVREQWSDGFRELFGRSELRETFPLKDHASSPLHALCLLATGRAPSGQELIAQDSENTWTVTSDLLPAREGGDNVRPVRFETVAVREKPGFEGQLKLRSTAEGQWESRRFTLNKGLLHLELVRQD